LLAEAREINMARLNNGDRHLSSAYTDLHTHKEIDLHIHKDIDRMVRCASKSCPSEQKPMMIWTKFVQPFVSINHQLPESNGTVASKEACEYCGFDKTFLRSIPDSSFVNNIPLSSKVCTCVYHVMFFRFI
jgi:paired amphipathic helix protein Sin3a